MHALEEGPDAGIFFAPEVVRDCLVDKVLETGGGLGALEGLECDIHESATDGGSSVAAGIFAPSWVRRL